MFGINLEGHEPIHEQLSNSIKKLVLTGILEKDSPLPSVRELALDLAINPNTVQKAYSFLEQQGITYSISGKGRFVGVSAADLKKMSQAELISSISPFIKTLKSLDMNLDELKAEIEKVYKEETK